MDVVTKARWLIRGGALLGVLTYVMWLQADIDSSSDRIRAEYSGSGELVDGVSAGPYIFFGAVAALLVVCGTILYASSAGSGSRTHTPEGTGS